MPEIGDRRKKSSGWNAEKREIIACSEGSLSRPGREDRGGTKIIATEPYGKKREVLPQTKKRKGRCKRKETQGGKGE